MKPEFKYIFFLITFFLIGNNMFAQDERINLDYIFQDPPLINPRPAIHQYVNDHIFYYADENTDGNSDYTVYNIETGKKEIVNDTVSGVYSVKVLGNSDAVGIIRGDLFYKRNYLLDKNFIDAVRIFSSDEYIYSPLITSDHKRIFYSIAGNIYAGEFSFVTSDSIFFTEIQLTEVASDSISFEILRISSDGNYALITESNNSGLPKINYPVYSEDDVILNSSIRGPRKKRNFIYRIDYINASASFSEINFPFAQDSYIRDALFLSQNDNLIIDVIRNDNKERNFYRIDLNEDRLNPISIISENDNWIETTGIGMSLINESEFIFSSERNGWHNIYKFNFEKKNIEPFIEGEFEIYELQIDVNNKKIFYTANKDHPASYKIYETDFNSSYHKKISTLEGNYKSLRLNAGGNKLIYLYSEILSPDELYYSDLVNEFRITISISENFSSVNWTRPEIISFINKEDGETVYANLYRAVNSKGKTPLIMFAHGAGYMQSVTDGFPSYIDNLLAINYFIRNGYTVLDVDYRGSSGYGKKFRNKTYRNLGYWEISDYLSGIDHLHNLGLINKSKVGIYGGSYGGFIALKAAFEYGDYFSSAAAMRSVSDWKYYYKSFYFYTVARLDDYNDNKILYQNLSPVYKSSGLKIPLFILHGMEDDNVLFQDFVMLTDKLIKEGKDFEMMIYPKERHNFRFRSSWKDSYKRIFDFFERTLK